MWRNKVDRLTHHKPPAGKVAPYLRDREPPAETQTMPTEAEPINAHKQCNGAEMPPRLESFK